MTIGERAVREVIKHAGSPSVSAVRKELVKLDIPDSSYRGWKRDNMNPSAYYLAKMASAGYDIYWILLGEKHGEEK